MSQQEIELKKKMNKTDILKVKVWGDTACFTHPALKTERGTYPVITPSACDGILRSIYWKPAFKYEVVQVDILNAPEFRTIMNNEIQTVRSLNDALRGTNINIANDRTQRNTELIVDPAYVIHARMVMVGEDDNPIKHSEIFKRRVRKGQCFSQPFFGLKEMFAHFSEVSEEDVPVESFSLPGFPMFHYFLYPENGTPKNTPMQPKFFTAKVVNGVMEVPPLNERYFIGGQ